MPSTEKVKEVEELKERLSQAAVVIATGFTTLDGATMTDFRQQLRAKGIEYKVIKNTLAAIAADEIGMTGLKPLIQGPTGIALGFADPVDAIKALDTYVKTARNAMTVRGAVLGGQAYKPEELTRLISLPPKNVLMSQLLGQMQAPMTNLVVTLNGPITNLVYTLDQTIAGLVYALQARVRQMEATAKS